MEEFKLFRHKSNGEIRSYPEHYINHPVFGADLELWTGDEDEYEVDKVVVENHEIPVDQRGVQVAVAYDDMTVPELRELLSGRELPTSGNKEELIERLVANNADSKEN